MKMMTIAAAAVAVAIGTGTFAGRDNGAEKITIMVGGTNEIIYLPAILAKRLGYFEQQGLDVDIVTEPAGVYAEDEMIAGAAQGVVGFYDHTIDLQTKGIEVESLVQFTDVPGEVELVSTKAGTQIRSPADFKHQSLGVTVLGSSTDFLTRYLASKVGLDQDDFQVKAVGAGPTFVAAMRANRIIAGMTTEPTASELISTGEAKVLVDLRTEAGTRAALGGIYPAACLYMPAAWVNAHRQQAAKLVRAFVEALRYLHAHSAEQIIAHLPRSYCGGGGRALYIAALNAFLPIFSTDGRMPSDGPMNVLRVLSAINPDVSEANIDLSKTYTTVFVDQVARK